jgi:hypothetical protein
MRLEIPLDALDHVGHLGVGVELERRGDLDELGLALVEQRAGVRGTEGASAGG